MVIKVERWETSDEKTFKSKGEAESHQKEIDFRKEVEKIIRVDFMSACAVYSGHDVEKWFTNPDNREMFKKLFA